MLNTPETVIPAWVFREAGSIFKVSDLIRRTRGAQRQEVDDFPLAARRASQMLCLHGAGLSPPISRLLPVLPPSRTVTELIRARRDPHSHLRWPRFCSLLLPRSPGIFVHNRSTDEAGLLQSAPNLAVTSQTVEARRSPGDAQTPPSCPQHVSFP